MTRLQCITIDFYFVCCQGCLRNYLVEEIGALCKLRSQGMLSPVNPEISSEGLWVDRERVRTRSRSVVMRTEKAQTKSVLPQKSGCVGSELIKWPPNNVLEHKEYRHWVVFTTNCTLYE